MQGVLYHLVHQLFFCFAIQSFAPGASGSASVNRTIDDDNGDVTTGQRPSYAPDGGWARGQECTGCAIAPDTDVVRSMTLDGSWHDSTYHPGEPDRTITVSFTGTAVYVFHLIANGKFFPQGVTTFTNFTFYIDDEYVGSFTQPASTDADKIRYSVPVYTNTTLPNKLHVLETRASGPTASLILFDAVIYTVEDVDPSSPSENNTTSDSTPAQTSTNDSQSSLPIGAIAGGTVGGVVIVGIIIATLLYVRKRRARWVPSAASKVEPFAIDGDSRAAPAEDSSGGRRSRAPMLPDLRFGRSRLMPRPSSSTTARGSSTTGTETTVVDTPRGHRPRLPPAPSTAGASTRSVAQTELIRRIQALESQMHDLEGAGTPSTSSGTRTTRSDPSSRASDRSRGRSRSRGRTRTGHSPRSGRSASHTATLRSELASLRGEITLLRAELEQEQQLVAEVPPPLYNG